MITIRFRNAILLVLTTCLMIPTGIYVASANDQEQTLLATGAVIDQLCRPVIAEGASFRDVINRSDLPLSKYKKSGGIQSSSLSYGNNQTISVTQNKKSPNGCDISVFIQNKSDVKPTVQFVAGKWGCMTLEGAKSEGRTLIYSCPQAIVKLDIFGNGEDTALFFRFSPVSE